MWEAINQKTADVVSDKEKRPEDSPEKGAEELFALWRDYQRQAGQIGHRKEPDKTVDPIILKKISDLKQAIAARWHNPEIQAVFKESLQRSLDENLKTKTDLDNYKELKKEYDSDQEIQAQFYRDVFARRQEEPDELTQINLAELFVKIKGEEEKLRRLEAEDCNLAAQLSFERLKNYHEQLAQTSFIWTPSREEYFKKITEHLVVVDQNHPLLLAGETGTGKTRLARAVSQRLTGKLPYEVGEEAKTDIRPLLGSRALDAEGSYVNYGQLGQALTGKETSREEKAGPGGIFYMDEMNGYPPDALRSLTKQISGRRAGEEITFAAWAGKKEKLSPNFGFLGSANLPSEKHPDRADLPVEVARELPTLEIDYPPQSPDNPELYEMMLAALMDKNGRLRLSREELAPAYKEIADAPAQEKQEELDIRPSAGGTLWRFANLVGEVQKSYKGQNNVLQATEGEASYLRVAVLDPGLVLSWLSAYRKSVSREQMNLETFLAEKLTDWAEQKIYPEEDRNLLRKFIDEFKIDANNIRYPETVLTPAQIGALSPRVPRRIQALKEAPKPLEACLYLPSGEEVLYNPATKNPESGVVMVKNNDPSGNSWIFKGYGLKDKEDQAVLEHSDSGTVILINCREFEKNYSGRSLIFSEKYNDKEIKLDVLKTRQVSSDFYKSHNLTEYLGGLPKEIRFSKDGEARIKEALKMGFDTALVLPPFAVQQKNIELLDTELAAKVLPGLSKADQYDDPYFEDGTKTAESLNRPAKAYLLLYQSGDIPQETKGQSPDNLRPLFEKNKWNGLTLPEYLVLQRVEAEKRKNHGFDAYNNDATVSNWTWLLDTKIAPSQVVYAHWRPFNRQVGVYWLGSDYSFSKLGARPVVVVEIL